MLNIYSIIYIVNILILMLYLGFNNKLIKTTLWVIVILLIVFTLLIVPRLQPVVIFRLKNRKSIHPAINILNPTHIKAKHSVANSQA